LPICMPIIIYTAQLITMHIAYFLPMFNVFNRPTCSAGSEQ